MKTKENKAMRLAAVLLVLTLLATSLIAGTFAKYTTGANGSAEARVAKFGVDVSVDATKVFGKKYKDSTGNNVVAEDSDNTAISVEAADMAVAPGTTGSMTFSVEGAPETKVSVQVDLADGLKEIKLVQGEYTNGKASVTLQEDYYPVKWTLTKDGTAVETDVTLAEIDTYFATISKAYAPGEFSGVAGKYTLSWKWEIEDAAVTDVNVADTILGDLAADPSDADIKKGGAALTEADYSTEEEFAFSVSVTQED